uniref:C2H2-type domain-containing protein n=1 Tax=Meloidogyne incognita TaxID=6306 RepID=A0A914MFT6_MELIC
MSGNSKKPKKQQIPIKNKFNPPPPPKRPGRRKNPPKEEPENEEESEICLNENDLDALFVDAAETIDSTEEEIYKRPEPPPDFEKCNFDEDTYRCIYCNLNCIYARTDRHLKTKRHLVLKQAHEESDKNKNPKNDNPYPVNCPNDGCYTASSLGKKYVYCIDSHQNAQTGAKNKNSLLKSANKHRLSNSQLNRRKSVGLVVKVAEEESSSSSEESEDDDIISTSSLGKDETFSRYLELKKTFKDLCYCIYCKEHFRLVRRERHLDLQKHVLNKQNYKVNEKNKGRSTFNEDETFGPTNCFVKSKEGKKLAFCIYCKTSYSTKRKSNLIDHVKTTKHRLALVAVKGETIQQNSNEEVIILNENEEEIEELSDDSCGIIGRDDADESDSSISLDELESVATKLAAYLSKKRRRRKRMGAYTGSKSFKQEPCES